MAARTLHPAPTSRRPLLVTDDTGLLDEILALAARAGTEVEVAPDPVAARKAYGTAPLVLVGVADAPACARAGLPRRPGVVLVGPPGLVPEPGPPWQLAEALGAEHIALLPAAAPWLVDRLTMSADVPAPGRVLAVVGGRGGAGASVLATALAVTAARADERVLLVDADPFGGGLDLVLGWEEVGGMRWPDLADTAGTVHPPALVEALPRRGELALLSCGRDGKPLPAAAMGAAVDAGRRGRDLVVVDLPRRFDDAAVVALAAADQVLLVVPAELRACAAATRVAAAVLAHTDAVSLVVRGPARGRLRAAEIARALGLPLAGCFRLEPAVAAALEQGEPPAGTGVGPLAELCRQVLAGVAAARGVAA